MPCEWVVAGNADPARRLLYVHGGGYVAGDLNSHRNFCADLSKATGAVILNAAYRLAPEHVSPAAFDDGMAAYGWMLENGPHGAGRPETTFVGGDSAGGGLALALAMGIRDAGLTAPAAAILLSPWADMTCSGTTFETRAATDPMVQRDALTWMAGLVLGEGGDAKDPRISPVFGSYENLPPLLVHVSEDEVLLDDSLHVADSAGRAGVDVTLERWPDTVHVWHVLGNHVPEAVAAIDKIGAFVREHGQADGTGS